MRRTRRPRATSRGLQHDTSTGITIERVRAALTHWLMPSAEDGNPLFVISRSRSPAMPGTLPSTGWPQLFKSWFCRRMRRSAPKRQARDDHGRLRTVKIGAVKQVSRDPATCPASPQSADPGAKPPWRTAGRRGLKTCDAPTHVWPPVAPPREGRDRARKSQPSLREDGWYDAHEVEKAMLLGPNADLGVRRESHFAATTSRPCQND